MGCPKAVSLVPYCLYYLLMTFALWPRLEPLLSYLLMTLSSIMCSVTEVQSCVYNLVWQQYLTGLSIGRWNYLQLSAVSCTSRRMLNVLLSIDNQCVYDIGQTKLPVVDSITDLGITCSNRLKFWPDVDNISCFQSRDHVLGHQGFLCFCSTYFGIEFCCLESST